MDYRHEAPEIIKNFLMYHETVKGHSKKTVDEYYLDLRNFFRFLKISRNIVPRDTPFDEIDIGDVDAAFVSQVTLSEVYDYLSYLARDRAQHGNSAHTKRGLSATSRARKIATIRSFYKYLTVKSKVLSNNPVMDLDSPKVIKSLPRYLTLEESKKLLSSVDGKYALRDYCILTLFLNCGLRISELVNLNLSDISSNTIRILGKGNKERIVYLNDACTAAIDAYLKARSTIDITHENALFLSSRRQRISKSTVHNLVKIHLEAAGLDSSKYSAHKLRHTAATLMLHNGVDLRTLQELLGHEHLNTTEIYTHIENENLQEAASLSPLSEFIPESKDNK